MVHELKHPFRDGTIHVLFEPLDYMARPQATQVGLEPVFMSGADLAICQP